MMKRDTFELIQKLEGNIEPCAETNIDNDHLANLKERCELHERIIDEIISCADDFWRKFYEIVSPDIDNFFTYYCSYSETCFDIYYKGERLNSLIFNKHHNQFEWVDDDMPITFWGVDKEIKKTLSDTFKQLLGDKVLDLCKSLNLKG